MLTNGGLFIKLVYMTGLAAELLKILQSSTCYGTYQLFSLCTHGLRPYGDSGKEGRGVSDTAFAFISRKIALANLSLHLWY